MPSSSPTDATSRSSQSTSASRRRARVLPEHGAQHRLSRARRRPRRPPRARRARTPASDQARTQRFNPLAVDTSAGFSFLAGPTRSRSHRRIASLRQLAALSAHRFANFAEAPVAALTRLCQRAIPGTIVSARFDPSDETCHMTDLRGAPMHRPQARHHLRVSTPGVSLDQELVELGRVVLARLPPPAWPTAGRRRPSHRLRCRRRPPYGAAATSLVALASRSFAFSGGGFAPRPSCAISRGGPRRRKAGSGTGLFDRNASSSARPRVASPERGAVQSHLVACSSASGAVDGPGSQVATLALQGAAEVLAGVTRATTTSAHRRVDAGGDSRRLPRRRGRRGLRRASAPSNHAPTQRRPFTVDRVRVQRRQALRLRAEALSSFQDAAVSAPGSRRRPALEPPIRRPAPDRNLRPRGPADAARRHIALASGELVRLFQRRNRRARLRQPGAADSAVEHGRVVGQAIPEVLLEGQILAEDQLSRPPPSFTASSTSTSMSSGLAST